MSDRKHVKWDVRGNGRGDMAVTRTEVSTRTQGVTKTQTRKTSTVFQAG